MRQPRRRMLQQGDWLANRTADRMRLDEPTRAQPCLLSRPSPVLLVGVVNGPAAAAAGGLAWNLPTLTHPDAAVGASQGALTCPQP